jgi:SAM-dependent methyltransferase
MSDTQDLAKSAQATGSVWKESTYYDRAESWTPMFWDRPEPFRQRFDRLNREAVIELACGHGRHAAQIAGQCGKLTLVDMHAENIEFCRRRLAGHRNVDYLVNNGFDLWPFPSGQASAVFSYDAMVHFGPDVVGAYLFEIARVLRPGGRALLHHSNNSDSPQWSQDRNPHARHFMTKGLFDVLARGAGLRVIDALVISWAGVNHLDCISMVQKEPNT